MRRNRKIISAINVPKSRSRLMFVASDFSCSFVSDTAHRRFESNFRIEKKKASVKKKQKLLTALSTSDSHFDRWLIHFPHNKFDQSQKVSHRIEMRSFCISLFCVCVSDVNGWMKKKKCERKRELTFRCASRWASDFSTPAVVGHFLHFH